MSGKNIKQHLAHALATSLRIKCKQRKKRSKYAGDNSDNGKNPMNFLPAVLAEESAFLHYCPTFMSYMVTIFALLKAALFHKRSEYLIITGWKYSASEKGKSET